MLGFRKMQAHSSLRVLSLGEKNRCAPEALASPAKVLATSKLGTLKYVWDYVLFPYTCRRRESQSTPQSTKSVP